MIIVNLHLHEKVKIRRDSASLPEFQKFAQRKSSLQIFDRAVVLKVCCV